MSKKVKDECSNEQGVNVNADSTQAVPQKKNSKMKNFLQLVFFILLSMAGFIVQMIIEQVGSRLGFVKDMNENTFMFFGLKQQMGAFIVTLIAVFVCKVINFVLHRKVLFGARANIVFSIVSYVVISVILWIGSCAIKVPVQNMLMGTEWWPKIFKSDPEGWALTMAIMVYSTADLIIMFFAEKFVIMNDNLFKKKTSKVIENNNDANEDSKDDKQD